MRDLEERDAIREKYAGQPGISGQVERLMGQRENAEAYGQDDLVKELDGQLGGFGHTPARVRAARKAAAEKRAVAEDDADEARKQAPAERQSPAERKQATAGKPGPGTAKG